MEETLGKRIVSNRKRLGLTQDALAEQLGVTAQAVSKWENDQSCPDIAMLPKLALIFGITTDALLGLETQEVHTAQMVTEKEQDAEPEGLHFQKGDWEFQWDSGRRGSMGVGVWVLLIGALLLFSELTGRETGLLNLLWPTALLTFGLFGIYPKFSVFRLGCGLFGVYCLLDLMHFDLFGLDLGMILPLFLLLTGLHLVVKALRKPKHSTIQVHHGGKSVSSSGSNRCTYTEEGFDSTTSFGDNHYLIQLPRLSQGSAQVNFGSMTIDLSGCEEIAVDCHLDMNCSFGELEVLVPRRWKAEIDSSASFASVDVHGNPDPVPQAVIGLNCSASFGEITIRYI